MVFDNRKTQVFLKLFLMHIILSINIYGPKKLEITLPLTVGLFLKGCVSTRDLKSLFSSFGSCDYLILVKHEHKTMEAITRIYKFFIHSSQNDA
jgi:hypothetical protein